MTLETGYTAPDFNLPDAQEKNHRLSDYRGKWVLLYFYPKDHTRICTQEACQFRDDQHSYQQLNTVILGVSTDHSGRHISFADKHDLPFPLLADVSGKCSKLYGALHQLGPFKICKRQSFLIDPQGNIAKIYRCVSVTTHSDQIQQDIKQLQAADS